MLQPPAIIISVLLASIYGLSFGLLIGKTGHRLWWYWAFAVAGFFLGFLIAAQGRWSDTGLGQVPIVESSVGSVAMLVLAAVLRR